jgi:S-adenosylmethionine-dependent methyltransferase
MNKFVQDYYNNHAIQEWERLDTAECKIEFASTLHLIEKYFPKRGKVCDIGGGPGRYTIELARLGYEVTLFDISEEEINFARTRLEESRVNVEELIVGDARNLSQLVPGSFDAALLMGPMYHVIDSIDRIHILGQLKNILKPNGIAIVAYLNSWGLIRTGITDFPNWYNDIEKLRSMLQDKIFEGQILSNFTESYWATPETALTEIKSAGFELISYAGAEGFTGGMHVLIKKLYTEDPEAYANVLEVAVETCELSQYRDSTDHVHFVIRKSSNI